MLFKSCKSSYKEVETSEIEYRYVLHQRDEKGSAKYARARARVHTHNLNSAKHTNNHWNLGY